MDALVHEALSIAVRSSLLLIVVGTVSWVMSRRWSHTASALQHALLIAILLASVPCGILVLVQQPNVHAAESGGDDPPPAASNATRQAGESSAERSAPTAEAAPAASVESPTRRLPQTLSGKVCGNDGAPLPDASATSLVHDLDGCFSGSQTGSSGRAAELTVADMDTFLATF